MFNHRLLQLGFKIKNLTNYYEKQNQFLLNRKFIHLFNKNIKEEENIQSLINKYEQIIAYNCIIERHKLKLGYRKNKVVEAKQIKENQQFLNEQYSKEPIPLSLKYLNKNSELNQSTTNEPKDKAEITTPTQFPFENVDTISFSGSNKHITHEELNLAENEVFHRNEHYHKIKTNWMTDYENYDENTNTSWENNYGTPDPNAKVSNVPCGGCGALLHCKDTAIPGYIPSEIFHNHQSRGGQHLRSLICQRCHFLKYYNTALQVRVSAAEYPKILEKVKENKHALVILMVDLLDFPCSIWPNIIDILGTKRPIVLVGNKIDLLPQDSRGYLERIKQVLADNIKKSNLNQANIQHISLISAKTGYGIEELITKLHSLWKYKGDVYLVGCTNAGKSTLFNALLQSDYCKIKAVDLIQRATTSPWPGWRMYVRNKRLMSLNQIKSKENRLRKVQLQKTQNSKYATLIGNIERTFTAEEPLDDDTKDIFSIQGNMNASGKLRAGVNENDPEYKLSKWCYDTPGVIQPDQILHLLTTEELMMTLPKQLIQPRTFSVQPGFSIFLAGLGRLDVIDGPISMRFTVFASASLPVTICKMKDAENLYKELIGSELFKVPMGNVDRFQKWPTLLAGDEIKLVGVDWEKSCADIVLSSAGWISVTIGHDLTCILKAWTPEKRGIYIRDSILSKAVALRGRRMRYSPAYKKSKFFIN